MQRKFIFKAAVMAALRPVGNRHLSFSGFRKGSEKSAAFLFVAAGTDIWACIPSRAVSHRRRPLPSWNNRITPETTGSMTKKSAQIPKNHRTDNHEIE
jgi:hypothetical protein